MNETLHVEAGAYREAMARLSSAVHVVTTDGPGGRAGFTATAMCSVSDAPPTLLVCLNRHSSAHPAFGRNESLCVSTLAADQQAIAAAFGRRGPMAERFSGADWLHLATGAPALLGALVAFDCRIVSRSPVGTHDVLFCEVVALAEPCAADALVYANRRYHAQPGAQRTGLPEPIEVCRGARFEGSAGPRPPAPALHRKALRFA